MFVLSTVVLGGTPATSAPTSGGSITGTVFQDYNANGVMNTAGDATNPAVDVGVAGVNVTARCLADTGPDGVAGTADDTYAAPVTQASNSAGWYSLAVTGSPCRVEIDPVTIPVGMTSGPAGTGSGTNVQFVSAGATANFGLEIAADFCQNNPMVCNNVMLGGPEAVLASTRGLETFPYSASLAYQNLDPRSNVVAGFDEIGAVYGAAWNRDTGRLYSSAFLRRKSPFGPGGPGAIYLTEMADAATPTSVYADLATLFPGSFSPNSHPKDTTLWYNDTATASLVSKQSLGDLELSPDGNLLYTVGLEDKSLFIVPTTGAVDATTVEHLPIPLDLIDDAECPDVDVRPFGLGVRRDGTVFVGGVCSAQTSQSASDLRYYMWTYDAGAWTLAMNQSMVEYVVTFVWGSQPVTRDNSYPKADNKDADLWGGFLPWKDDLDYTTLTSYPQALITDIEFDGDDLIIGIRDRYGDQTPGDGLKPDQDPYPRGNGDIRRACLVGTMYVLDSETTCGGGDVEFYKQDWASDNAGQEAAMGALLQIPGHTEVLSTAFDPRNVTAAGTDEEGIFNEGGVFALSNTTGLSEGGYALYSVDEHNSSLDANGVPLLFGKTNGIGDIEALCDRAPIEIGNRVWIDGNSNGVQDPGEPALGGSTVTLSIDGDGAAGPAAPVTYTATTDADGRYIFSSDRRPVGERADGGTGGVYAIAEMVPDATFTLAVTPSVTQGATILSLTTPDIGSDTTDSDVVAATGVTPTFTVGAPGDNNHTYDMGYVPSPATLSLGNYIWRDDDNDGAFDAGTEVPLDGVTVRLFRPGFGPDGIPGNTDDADQIGPDQQTSDGGYFLFSGLAAGDYVIEVVTPAGMKSSTGPAGEFDGAGVPDADDVATDSDDNGYTFNTTTTRSKPITLAIGAEPTAEPATPGHPDSTPDASANYTVDFGFTPVYAIGNLVWFDAKPDGIRDPANPAETPVAGVTVKLYAADGTEIPVGPDGILGTADDAPGGVVTGPAGTYYFDNLAGGDYYVTFSPPAGYTLTTNAPSTPDAANDSNPDPATGRTPTITLGASTPTVDPSLGDPPTLVAPRIDRTIDAGLKVGYSLGNRVWLDTDNSGDMNGTETGAGNVLVSLLHADGTPVTDASGNPVTDLTDADGFYRFDGLLAGDYIVEVAASNFNPGQALAGGLPSTGAAQEADPDGDGDINDNGLDALVAGAIRSGVVTLGPGLASEPTGEVAGQLEPSGQGEVDARANMTVDFGIYVPTYAVGNVVWFDADRDGIQDAPATEPPVAGAIVRLFRADGSEVPVGPDGILGTADDAAGGVTTPASGLYYFDNLPAGDYSISFTPPAGMSLTTDAPAAPDALADSNPDPATGMTPVFTLGQALPDVSGAAGDPATLLGDKIDRTIDAGLVVGYSLGNRVWFDDDNSGDMNGAEAGIDGVVVNLLNADGTPYLVAGVAATDITSGGGFYRFDDLPTGDYVVEIAASNFAPGGALYGGHPSTGAAQEADPDADGDVNDNGLDTLVAGAIRSAPVTLGSGLASEPTGEAAGQLESGANPQGTVDARANMTVDFGIYVPKYTLGNLVWSDFDNDGTADVGEAPIPGVTVQLLMEDPANPGIFIPATDAAGDPVADQITGPDGLYRFADLLEGTYKVVIPAGQPALEGVKSSGTPNPSPSDDVDGDNNGVPQADGSFVSGPVTLGPLGSEPTNEVDGLTTGTPDQDTTPSDNLGNWSVDFGFFRGIRIGNLVWLDGLPGDGVTYDNGIVDAGETPIGGVAVELWRDNGDGAFDPATDTKLDETATDSDGNYWFENVVPGDRLFIAIPTVAPGGPLGVRSSTPQSAGPDALDNDDDGAPLGTYLSVSGLFTAPAAGAAPTGEADGIPAADGSAETEANSDPNGHVFPDTNSDLRIDFGFVNVPLYRLGNLVWIDADKDGIADPGEGPLADVTVELYDDAGNLAGSTQTGPDGKYLFENLSAGTYEVRIPTGQAGLAGYFSSPVNETSADADGDNNDNGVLDAGGAFWTSGPVTLGNGDLADEPFDEVDGLLDGTSDDDTGVPASPDDRSNLTVDFGFYRPIFALGNEVWFDLDDSGMLDNGEAYVPDGVVVNLLDGAGEPILDAGGNPVTTTTVAGRYLFDGLLAGDYIVELDAANFAPGGLLEGYASSTGQTTDDTDRADHGDDDTTDGIQSPVITLAEGTEPTTENPNETTTAPDDNANMTADFGIVVTFALGNEVWIDLDDSGLLDNGEAYVPDGVLVNLLHADGSPVAVGGVALATTTMGGKYLFDDLPAGTYIVELDPSNFGAGGLLAGYRSSTPTGGDDQTDQDDNGAPAPGGAIRTGPIVLGGVGAEPAAEDPTSATTARDTNTDLTIDLGVVPMFAIGNEVWVDIDDSGSIGAGEPYVPDGVKINLLDGTGAPVLDAAGNPVSTTTSGGNYLFDNLVAGDYIVEIDASNFTPGTGLLAGYRSSTFTGSDDGTDRDDNGAPVAGGAIRSGVIALGGIGAEPIGEDPTSATFATNANGDMTVDFGLVPLFALGNEVWIDADDSGVLDNGEAYVPDGVVMNLLHADGTPVLNGAVNPVTTTTLAGHYVFDNLVAGDYVVELAASNFLLGGPLQGYRSSTGQTTGEAIADDRHDHGDDTVTDGVRSPVVTLAHLAEPTAEVPTDTTVAADANANLVIDFGVFRPTFSLGNQIWYDLDDDGTIDAGEPPVPAGTTVTLFRADGTQLATTTTDATGLYLFSDLDAGDYYVETALPAGYRSSTPTETGDVDNRDHGTAAVNAGTQVIRSGVVSLTEGNEPTGENPDNDPTSLDGNENLTVDLGIVPIFSLGNEIWFDVDDNGKIDAGEAPVPDGVKVNLLRADGSKVTDPDGNPVSTETVGGLYLFGGLLAGDYIVEIDPLMFAPGGLLEHWTSSTRQDTGDNDGTDHGAVTPLGAIRSEVVTLSLGGEPTAENPGNDEVTPDANSNLTVDFGLTRLAIGNRVWIDTDEDGVRDATEPGVGGVRVELWTADATGPTGTTPLAITVTDDTGYYLFDGLAAGTYVIRIPASQLDPGGPLAGYISTEGNGTNAPDPDDNADDDDNGTQDEVNGWVQTLPFDLGAGSEPAAEADLAPGSSQSPGGVDLDANINLTVDLGFVATPPLSLGNRVWLDLDNDGVMDASETPIDGVAVHLYRDADADGVPDSDAPFQTQVTSQGGYYLFTGLAPGNYVVGIPASNFARGGVNPRTGETVPEGPLLHMMSSTGSHPADDGVDLDDSGIQQGGPNQDVFSSTVRLSYYDEPAGEGDVGPGLNPATDVNTNLTVDFGFHPLGSLGDYVWIDTNRDGRQDATEVGVDGVKVNLYDANGTLVATTTTAGGGKYLFEDLVPGPYTVEFVISTIPSGYLPTAPGAAGSSEADDSDGDVTTGRTAVFTVTPGGHEPRVDFGIHKAEVDLAIVKTVEGEVVANRNSTWRLVVSNQGLDAETGTITVVDSLPTQLSFVSAAGTGWTCTAAGQVVTCTTEADLPASSSLPPIVVIAKVAKGVKGEVANGATVASPSTDPNQPNNASLAKAPVVKGGALPGTGSDSLAFVLLGLGALLVGLGMLQAARRRPARTA